MVSQKTKQISTTLSFRGKEATSPDRGCVLRLIINEKDSFSVLASIYSSEQGIFKDAEIHGGYFKGIPVADEQILSQSFKKSRLRQLNIASEYVHNFGDTQKIRRMERFDFPFVQSSWWDAKEEVLSIYEDFSWSRRLDTAMIPWSKVAYETVPALKALAIGFTKGDSPKPRWFVWTSVPVTENANHIPRKYNNLANDYPILPRLDTIQGIDLILPTGDERRTVCELD